MLATPAHAAGRDPSPNTRGQQAQMKSAEPAPHLVILVHGIRDFALWHETVGRSLSDAGLRVEFTNYGRFDLLRFLLPLSFFRRRAIEEVLNQIRIAKDAHDGDEISIIAHSFGTYVVSHILQKNFDLKFSRVIFCGSVVRYGFPFEQLSGRFTPPILNEVGTRDIWPAMAESVTWGYGSAGTYGFRRPLVKDRWHNGAGHGFFLKPEFASKYWLPFITEGRVVPASEKPESPRLWIRLLSIFRLKYAALVLCALLAGPTLSVLNRHLFVGLPERETGDRRAALPTTVTVSLARGESPYLARKITAPPAPIATRYRNAAEYPTGYFLWPELDYDIVLFALRAGEETGPDVYMEKSEFLDESDPVKRQKRVRIWSIFEATGRRMRTALKSTDAVGQDLRELLPKPPSDDGQLGIAFLRLVYPGRGAQDAALQRSATERAVRIADQLMRGGEPLAPLTEERLSDAARLLATLRVQPVLNVSASSADRAQVVTGVQLEVLEVVGAFSALDSGPLTPVDTIRFDLGSKPETLVKSLVAPVKIAANDAILLRLHLRSPYMFSYLCRVVLVSGDQPVGRSSDFLVDFGFQPAEGG